MTLKEKVEQIQTYADFLAFVAELKRDYSENPSEWENRTVESYLEAIASWNIYSYYENWNLEPPPEHLTWKMFAQVLIAAKYYE
jgi:hypothetical protein